MDCHQIQFSNRPEPIDLFQLQKLLKSTDFGATERRLEELAIAVAHSDPVVTVWDGEKMIGFARATLS
ncbi:MAG: hypothetical protein QNJ18_03825 [Xenococcaceae cyanobacterium MO_167.B52]|nr:hypothetical protein [Xenococcaceae cyanobacterium MO_167.B52]